MRASAVRGGAVAFTTASYGINTGGAVYRMDDIPIPRHPAFVSPYPSDDEVLQRLEKRIREKQREASSTRQPAIANA